MSEGIVYFTRGIPSSLKTTAAQSMARMLHGSCISKDNIRKLLFPYKKYQALSFNELVKIEEGRDALFKLMLDTTDVIILDETFVNISDLTRARNLVPADRKTGLIDLTWMRFEDCFHLDMRREESRGFDSLFKSYEVLQKNPTSSILQLFDTVIGRRELEEWARSLIDVSPRTDCNEGISFP